MNRNNLIKERKGISPIIATLLLILIAIAAGVIVYAYVVGFIGNSTSNSGGTTNTLSIDQVALSSKATNFPVTAYVRNEGPSTESFNTGFFVKGSSLNDQLAPAISITATTGTLTIPATTTVSLAYLSVNSLTVSIGSLSCSVATTVTVSAFGVSGSATCPLSSAPETTTLTSIGATFSSTFAASTSTSIAAVATAVVGMPVTAGTLSVSINAVFQFTLATSGAQASSILSPGQTYTVQVTGTDGASTTASGKAS
ncbi:MAG: archaellin/type IV pilin N-terminal domain-containing protein [Nitrososphaerales archaeon]